MIKDLGPALVERLRTDTAIGQALAGSSGRILIFPDIIAPGFAGPACLVYTTVSEQTDHHHQGPSGLAQRRMQIDAWATVRGTANNLANLVKARLDGFRGVIASSASPAAFPAVRIRSILAEEMRNDYDGTVKLYNVSRDYLVWFAER